MLEVGSKQDLAFLSEKLTPELRKQQRTQKIKEWGNVRQEESSSVLEEEKSNLSQIIKNHASELAPFYAGQNKIALEEFGLAFEKGKSGEYRGRLKMPPVHQHITAGDEYQGDLPGSWMPEDASKFFLLYALQAEKGEITKLDVIKKEVQYMILENLV